MIVYIINIAFLILTAAILLTNDGIKSKKKIFIIIASIQWIILSGFRHVSVGADTRQYGYLYEQAEYQEWIELLKNFFSLKLLNSEELDYGYYLFQKTIHLANINYQSYLIIIAIMFTVPLGIWIYKNSSGVLISYLIYSTLFFSFFAITGLRQTLATAVAVLIGYEFVKKRNFPLFLITILVAFTIHKSALLFIIFYFVANKKITKKYVSIILICVPLLFYFKENVSAFFKYIGGYEDYGIYEGAGTNTFTSMMLLIMIVALWRKRKILENNKNAIHFYNALFISLLFLPLTYVNPSAMRVVQYFSIFIILLIPEIVKSFGVKERTLITYTSISVLLILFIRTNHSYLFFWQGG